MRVQKRNPALSTRERQAQPDTHLLLQLPGLLPPEQHLVPGFLVGVGHQSVSVVGPQLREEQSSGEERTQAGLGGQGQGGSEESS